MDFEKVIAGCKSYQCNEEELKEITEFVTKVREERKPRDKRNVDEGPHRFIREKVGKIGEVSAAKFYGGNVNFQIFPNNTYGHDIDLENTQTTYQDYVKTCSEDEAKKHGFSWIFAKGDPLYHSPTPNQRIILMCANAEGKAWVLGHVLAPNLTGRFGPCRALKHKVAIWLKTTMTYEGPKEGIENILVKD